MRNLCLAKEHVFGATKSDTFCAERTCLDSVAWNVSIGAHFQHAVRIGPCHEFLQLGIIRGWIKCLQFALDHAAGGAVERNPVARLENLPFHSHLLGLFIHVDVARARHATLAHTARDHSRVAGHTAARGENALCHLHAVNVFRRGLGANQNYRNFRSESCTFDCCIRRENDLADSCTWRCR